MLPQYDQSERRKANRTGLCIIDKPNQGELIKKGEQFMEWTKDLAVGIPKIDEQHRELFKRINDLLIAIREHRCRDEIDGTIRFLDDYAQFHFSEEEKRMEAAGYTGLQGHKLMHAVYLNNIIELKEQAALPRESGMSYELSVTANQIVVDWIMAHIMRDDKLFGEHMRQLKA